MKEEIKTLLRDATLWLHEEDLDLATEKIAALIDREKEKSDLTALSGACESGSFRSKE